MKSPRHLMRNITIVDIATEARVSFKTVSRVINNETGVGPATRARIQAILDERNFKPNVAARSLSGQRSYLIGLLFEGLTSHYYYSDVQIGAMRACRRSGYHLIIEETKDVASQGPKALRKALSAARLDGALLPYPVCDDPKVLSALDALEIPYVRITPAGDPNRSSYVGMDDRKAGYEMTKYLSGLGHRLIAFIGFNRHSASSRRVDGYREFMNEHNLETNESWIDLDISPSASSQEAAERLLKAPERPTAIFAASDIIAFGIMMTANKLGLSLPADLSIAGFDNSLGSEGVWPPLTTIHQPVAAMAENAVDILISELKSKSSAKPSNRSATAKFFDFELIKRASTAPPPG